MMETDRLLQQSFPNSRVLLQVHDELLIEARESDANQIMSAVRQVMERSDLLMSFTGHAMATPLKANVSCGASWGAL
jgi:DNA polymerase-1